MQTPVLLYSPPYFQPLTTFISENIETLLSKNIN